MNTKAPHFTLWAAAAGVVAAGLGVAAGELAAALLSPSLSPVSAVGSAVIDGMPAAVKDWAIGLFGTADKVAFLVSMAVVIAVVAAAAGVLELRRPPAGAVIIGLFGAAGLAAVLTRAQMSALSLLPPLLAAAVGILVLRALMVRIERWRDAATAEARAEAGAGAGAGAGTDQAGARRRDVLRSVGGGAVVGLAAGALAGSARGGQVSTAAVRDAVQLPAAVTPAAPLPAGAELGISGLDPVLTPAADFYRIDTALSVPLVNAQQWTLKVTGLVDREIEIDFAQLLAKPLQESWITLACVSNEVGGSLIGNAKWLGWPVRNLLAEAGVQSGADMVLSTSQDGWTASTPLEALTDSRDALLAVGMNGEPLPLEHGFPVRLVVPGLYGYVSATKWVTELRVSRFADESAYWTDRGWSERGPIKLSSRIDTPSRGAAVDAGTLTVAGMAWAQHTGIRAVQLRVDDGGWQDAQLAAGISADTWVQWSARVDLEAGDHTLTVRAVNAAGSEQDERERPVVPDGATGLHTVRINVR
ncbi:molybdopterin-dependent oxidoreductase [Arthrobacter sp. zg-ZUI100]|uniref:molybdopterin-dependent oxidoreductase n=1 Tax=Arthrobacter jiangjiafuii TaxID=2817475 RepID=UPI001AEE974C|nr:molybdopterin-dependent oxidoreductase [Arthrobacter jiangjiafuii]MBP3036994.1 molybdopterin-dependent oxidoreductase [Arthrobacter jiangjiafuii]